ncbi:hypothetical protein SOMG_02620 [Schizosaccharomyces osmophilus]|uniref:Uncharacterized protein n=1 Tax=Schizosaccharomyces osmophilus TaxID=2545709 RepID=A0AAE9WFD5_9SCHI|nr:uncharacterized protein SOMG_02620 [Schizosaccharomyces osmophilus]WBW74256.1 hypothetical protein SOMG_02620 [Schizosaccharomyces osmophilus]
MYAGRTSLLKIPSTKDEQTKRTLCKLVLQVVLSYIFTEERNKTDFGRFTLRLCPAIIHPY